MSHNIMNDFDSFLKNEKKIISIFNKKLQLKEEIFDLEEYETLNLIWKDIDLINNIYDVIDDIIKLFKLDNSIRFLIIGDFLFNFVNTDFKDPANIVFKISRNDYIYKIKFRAFINLFFDYDYHIYITIHKKLLIGLRLNGILARTHIKGLAKNWQSVVYLKLNINFISLEKKKPYGVSKQPYTVLEIAHTNYSISSFRSIWKIKRKKKEMEDVLIPFDGVIKANQIKFKLSRVLHEINILNIKNYELKLLKSTNCSNLTEYFLLLKKLLNHSDYAGELTNKIKFNTLLLKKKLKEEHINVLNISQKMILLQTLNSDIFDKYFFLPCFSDNRGRQYYSTLLSPTFYTLFRQLYEFGEIKKINGLEESTFYKKILNYSFLVKEFSKSDLESYTFIVLFIEVGKHFINSEDNFLIKTEEIIKLGIKHYFKNTKIEKFEDILYLEKIYYLLSNFFKKKNIDYNTIIYKDATASGLQNYGILLGYQENKLKYLNIDNDDWCDTYQYLITKFLKNKKYNKRKYWKKTIMTIPYNAEWYSCFSKFIEILREDEIEYNNMTEEEKNEIKLIHKDFYNDIKKNVKEEFYLTDSLQSLKLFKYNKWTLVNIEEYKINYKRARDKYINALYMLEEDDTTAKKAMEANNMHYLDAEIVRAILKKYEILSIHDCFGMRFSEIHLVLDEINSYYAKIIKKSTYSIHIII